MPIVRYRCTTYCPITRTAVEGFRLCTRTMYLNPIVQFLCWHMNYHIEHHMHAEVPCHKLARLYRAIQHELPYTTTGLYETWSIIIAILRRQKQEPGYQFVPELPAKARVSLELWTPTIIAVEVIITSAVIMVQVIDCEEEKGAYMAPADRC